MTASMQVIYIDNWTYCRLYIVRYTILHMHMLCFWSYTDTATGHLQKYWTDTNYKRASIFTAWCYLG